MSYGRCRPQLHAAGIGTWLEETYCEDTDLRPSTATEETVYAAVTQLGDIFNVPNVATQLNDQIRNDFAIAKQAVADSGHALTAILLDGVGCGGDDDMFFVGAGQGSVNLILTAAGMTNLFADLEGSYDCVSASDIIDANPDVLVIVEASWDSALNKIDYMHNNSAFCAATFVQNADYIKIPFSASALGPRNGAAALDLVSAAIHVTTGATTMNFESGVEFFDPGASATAPPMPHLRSRLAARVFPPRDGGLGRLRSAHPRPRPSIPSPQTCSWRGRRTCCARWPSRICRTAATPTTRTRNGRSSGSACSTRAVTRRTRGWRRRSTATTLTRR